MKLFKTLTLNFRRNLKGSTGCTIEHVDTVNTIRRKLY